MSPVSRPARTAVIGGGMAGCAAARTLVKAGREVVLFEAGEGLGGRARSWHRPEIEPHVGINLMYVSFYPLMTELIREYGLRDELVKISSDVYIVHKGRPVPLSSDSPLNLLKYPHAPLADRFRFLLWSLGEVRRRKQLDLFDPVKVAPFDDGTSAAELGYRKLSREGFDTLLRPQIEGFWNFACEKISAVHARALLAWLGGSEFYVFRDGMQVLAERNAEGADVRTGHEVTDLQTVDGGRVRVTARPASGEPVTETFDDVVVAVPAPIAAKLAAALPQEVVGAGTRRFLESQEYEPALSVSFLLDPAGLPSHAHIVAGGPDDPPLRNMITYPRRVRDEQGRPVDRLLVFAYPGRAVTRRLLGRPTEEQFAEVAPLLRTLWPDLAAEPQPFQIAERPFGFPIPAPGRYRRSVEVMRNQGAPVVFAGDYFNSPTTEAAMLSGVRAAEKLLGTR
ncbi:FAD-dependent oxidoreductase [Thermomonospora cellulosilytica]|uniref:Oxygen-dependent protoporphyrinogen oxidase n=1 Tax=Thermomonospora cellulosilytica TaxID=1411118 RepID=A0A7W3R838_9ACTN|nr:FAD-dependent oxidoreductase [Thermomonospora cellulosilytica]MBA9003164.1 oxygen-dependent protoporphyrinogen oxidase [Thermomonospora cellulosilytica]